MLVVLHVKRKRAAPLVAESPRKRLRSKASPADATESFWWRTSEGPQCLFSLGPNLQRQFSEAVYSLRVFLMHIAFN